MRTGRAEAASRPGEFRPLPHRPAGEGGLTQSALDATALLLNRFAAFVPANRRVDDDELVRFLVGKGLRTSLVVRCH
jgi:hypothetical protein